MTQWEYGEVVVDKNRLFETIELLDSAGKDGWESAGILEENVHYKMYLMKRPIIEEVVVLAENEIKHDHSVTKKCGAFCELRGTKHEIVKNTYP